MKTKIITYTSKYKTTLVDFIQALNNFEYKIEKTKLTTRKAAEIYAEKLTTHPKTTICFLEIENKIAGFITLCLYNDKDFSSSVNDYCLIQDLYIKEEYRRQGFGKLLYKEAEKFAKAHKIKHLLLYALADNYNALAAYKKMGFRKYEIALTKEL